MRTCTGRQPYTHGYATGATHSVACRKEFGKDAGQKLDLTRRPNELFVDHTARVDLVLDALKQEWMLAYLPKLHQLVAQTLDTGIFAANNVNTISKNQRYHETTNPFESFPSAIILCFFICL